MSGRVWTISNALSLCRLALVAPIVFLLARNDGGDRPLITGLIVLAVATDFFDGLIARRLGQVTDLGKIIDPVADKVAVAAVAVALALLGRIPFWFLAVAVVRDILILVGGLVVRHSRGILLQSNLAGKWAAAVTATYLLAASLAWEGGRGLELFLLWASTVMLLVSGIAYAHRFLKTVRS